MLRIIGTVLLFVLIVLLPLTLGGAALLLLAYGLGLLVSWVTHFEPFQATILALAAITATGILAERIFKVITSSPLPFESQLDEDEDDEDEEEDEDDRDEELFINPGIPRWRQPLKQTNFTDVDPDSRCPCGSGRKYKNCHGSRHPKPL